MKINKKGVLSMLAKSITYNKICPNCKTEYEFEEREARRISTPGQEPYWSIVCPFCKLYNYFDSLEK